MASSIPGLLGWNWRILGFISSRSSSNGRLIFCSHVRTVFDSLTSRIIQQSQDSQLLESLLFLPFETLQLVFDLGLNVSYLVFDGVLLLWSELPRTIVLFNCWSGFSSCGNRNLNCRRHTSFGSHLLCKQCAMERMLAWRVRICARLSASTNHTKVPDASVTNHLLVESNLLNLSDLVELG